MKLAFISQPEYFRFMYEHELDFLGEVREFVFTFSMTEKDFGALEEYDPDVSFFFRGEFFPEEVLRRLRGIKVSLSSEPFPNVINGELNYTLDSLKRYIVFRRIAHKSFDYVFHYDASSLPFIENDGMHLSGVFYFPVATTVYRKEHREKKWDFFFIGRSTAYREKFLLPLKHQYHFLHICHGVWGEELVDYANQSRILINLHAENEMSWEPRVQMLMATGNMIMSEKITPNPYLIPGRDYVEFASRQDLHEKADYYLKHEEEREAIALNGMRTIHAMFDAKKLFPELIDGIMNQGYGKASYSPGRSGKFLRLGLNAVLKHAWFSMRESLSIHR